jgi:hypothetical protein
MESTSTRARLSAAGELNVTGMVAAAAGIIMQIASGSDLYPMIPPGPIILLAGAALVALGPFRWGGEWYCPGRWFSSARNRRHRRLPSVRHQPAAHSISN